MKRAKLFTTVPFGLLVHAAWLPLFVSFLGLLAPTFHAQTTDLTVTKSGNDILLSWSTGSPDYTVALSNTNPQFPQGQALATGLSSGPYTYSGGLTNGVSLQFFDVSGAGETSPLLNYTGGAVPPPVPIISSISPTTCIKVGDPLTINGQGFSTIPTENVVHFPEGITAPSSAATATAIQVTVPRSALSGSIWVQVGHQASNTSSAIVCAQTGFSHLSGVAHQPTTKNIWLTDRGSGSGYPTRVVQLSFSGSSWAKTESEIAATGTPKYHGGQGFDSAQAWFYGLANSNTNGATRKKATNPPGAATAFTNIKPSSGNSIQVIGVATGSSLTDTAFFAYYDVTTGEKHIRKISGGGVLDTDYGNFAGYSLPFASLAGLALDQYGNLYDTETTQVRQITPAEASTVLVTGFTGAMGIAHDQVNTTTDSGTLLVTDFNGNSLYKVELNQSAKERTLVKSGLGLPRASAFATTPLNAATCGALPNTDLSFVLIAEDTQVRQIPDPRITMEPAGPTHVWISKLRADDAYPSQYQSADHQIVVTASVTPIPNPSRAICFRVVDPLDTAPYGDGSTTGYWCDNKDPGTSNNAGKLWNPATSSWNSVVCVQTNGSGQASVTLNTTDRYAGDNYIVQASYDDWTSAATKALAQTGVITGWKRLYIEKDRMYRRGGLLFEDFNTSTCGSNCDKIKLYDWANVANGDSVIIFDEVTTAESGGETRTIVAPPAPGPPGSGYITVALNAALSKNYYATDNDGASPPAPIFSNDHCAGIGVPSTSYYDADLSSMWQTYNDGFTQYWVPPDIAGATPYLDDQIHFYDYYVPGSTPPTIDAQAAANRLAFEGIWGPRGLWYNSPYIYLLGCRGHSFTAGTFTAGYTDATNNYSYIYIETVESWGTGQGFTSSQIAQAVQTNVVHEIGHQFFTNVCTDLLDCGGSADRYGKHDYRGWWYYGGTGCPSANPCIMYPSIPNPPTPVNRFCIDDLLLGDPNCSSTPPPRRGAVRTEEVPLP